MCFYDEGDWCPAFSEITHVHADHDCRCLECGSRIFQGEWCRHVYMQEHEECTVCEWEEAETLCENHDFGEVVDDYICHTCLDILKAIETLEEEEGCPSYARQPLYGELAEALDYSNDGYKYVKKAREMFPGIQSRLLYEKDEDE